MVCAAGFSRKKIDFNTLIIIVYNIISNMEFTEENCNKVISIMENDESKGMEMMMNLMNSYQEKYKIKKEELFEKAFRKDTKLIFQVLHNVLGSEKMVQEMEKEFDDDELDQKDKKEFLEFVDNINFVLQKIDTVDLLDPDDEFSSNCTNAMSFLNKKNEDMKGLTESMKKLTLQLEGLGNALKKLPNDLNIPTATPINPEDDDIE